jgi:hypothetical protein
MRENCRRDGDSGVALGRVNEASRLIKEHFDEVRSAWAKHFPG